VSIEHPCTKTGFIEAPKDVRKATHFNNDVVAVLPYDLAN